RLSLFRDCVVPGLRPGFLCFEIVWCRVSDPAFFVSKLCGAGSPTRLSLFRDCVVPGLRPGFLCLEIVWCRVSDPAFFVSRLCGAGSPTPLSLFRNCVVPGLRPGILCFEIVWCRVSDPAFFSLPRNQALSSVRSINRNTFLYANFPQDPSKVRISLTKALHWRLEEKKCENWQF